MDAVNEALTMQEGPYFLDDFSLVGGTALFSSIETRLRFGKKSMWVQQAAHKQQRSDIADAMCTSEPKSRQREQMKALVSSLSYSCHCRRWTVSLRPSWSA